MNLQPDLDEDPREHLFSVVKRQQSSPSIFAIIVAVVLVLSTVFAVSVPDVVRGAWRSYAHLLERVRAFLFGASVKSMEGSSSSVDFGQALHGMAGRGGGLMAKVLGLGAGGLLKADIPLRGVGTLLKTTSHDRPPGLGNYDNSCYQNSVLQGLASLHVLPKSLQRAIDAYSQLQPSTTSSELQDIISRLNDARNNGYRLWTPRKLKSMSSWQQQDAQEYFSKVLDDVDKEINIAQRDQMQKPGLETTLLNPSLQQNALSQHGAISRASEQLSGQVWRNPVEGYLAYRSGCTECKYSEGLKMVPFKSLTLPLGRGWTYNLQGCLDQYTTPDYIDGVECGKCTLLRARTEMKRMVSSATDASPFRSSVETRLQTIENALDADDFSDRTLIKECFIPKKHWKLTRKVKQEIIGRPPQCLVLHVNRSIFNPLTGQQYKNTARLEFQNTLNLSSWCLGGASAGGSGTIEEWPIDPTVSMLPAPSEKPDQTTGVTYRLRAVITHYGAHENGHYICYRKSASASPEPSEDASDADTEDDEGKNEAQPIERWWRLSDDAVSPVSEGHVLSQPEVFMLFYERICQEQEHQAVQENICSSVVDSVPSRVTADNEDATLPITAFQTSDADDSVIAETEPRDGLPLSSTSTPRPADDPSEHQSSIDPEDDDDASDADSRTKPDDGLAAQSLRQPLKMRTAGFSHQSDQSCDGLRMVAAT